MTSPFKKAADNEELIKTLLFCGLTRAIKERVFYSEDRPLRVLTEVPTNKGSADIVITKMVVQEEIPILVIECKRRILEALGRGFAEATSQALRYSLSLNCPIFSVYDGSIFLFFKTDSPYLIKVSEIKSSELSSSDYCYNLLCQLMERQFIVGMIRQILPRSSLPTPTDKALLGKTIFPVVARALVREHHKYFGLEIEEEDVIQTAEGILPFWNKILETA